MPVARRGENRVVLVGKGLSAGVVVLVGQHRHAPLARDADGMHRIVGRMSTDLIKSGGYRIGAGEIEGSLLGHGSVAEVAVVGVADDDLGQRIVAFVVRAAHDPTDPDTLASTLIDHVARSLSAHKRPREIRFVDDLPRNAMGKVVKKKLLTDG